LISYFLHEIFLALTQLAINFGCFNSLRKMNMKQFFFRKAWLASITTALVLSACGGTSEAPPEAAFTLQLLHISDADGSDTTALNSVANLSGLINKFRAQYPQQTLTVSSGDNYIPGPRFNAADNQATMRSILGREAVGRGDIAMLNAMGVQASALGNHELDLGTGPFKDMVAPQSSGGQVVWPGAQFPYLSFNTEFTRDSNTASITGTNGASADELKGKVAGWTRVQVGNQTIGIIGASSPVFKNITSTGGLVIEPALSAAGEVDVDALAARLQLGVDAMTAAGIDKIVMLSHMQSIAIEKALATKLKNVDIIVAGGSNTRLADADDKLRSGESPAGDYPFQVNDAAGNPVVVVNVDADYKYLGRFMAPFDNKGVLIPQRFDRALSGAWVTSETDDTAGGVTPSGKVIEIRDGLKGVIAARDSEFYGLTSIFLEGRRAFVRTEETNLGNLSADANLAYAQDVVPGVQISMKNGGGIRAELGYVKALAGSTTAPELLAPQANPDVNRPQGAVSRLMIEAAFKFDNKLWVFDITAARLHALLEWGVGDVENIGGRFPQVSGFSFSFDPAATKGTLATDGSSTTPGRVRSLKIVNDVLVRNGVLQGDPNRTFRLVTLNFLATGGDGYKFGATDSAGAGLSGLRKLEAEPASATALGGGVILPVGGEQDALAEYLKKFHSSTPYGVADTPAAQDLRIQNLSKRSDTVLELN
jgi:2',3'-cyclic-nucleotide 2'-phosphodiesterase (5'-nucleotidase family)